MIRFNECYRRQKSGSRLSMKLFAANWTLWVFTLMTALRLGLSEMIADMNMYLDPDDMAYNLRNILDNAGLKQMQAVLDKKVKIQTKDVNPGDYIQEAGIDLSCVLRARDGIFVSGDILDLKIAITMVSRHYVGPSSLAREVRYEYEKAYLNFPRESEIPDCSDLEGQFYGQLDTSTMCQLVPPAVHLDPGTAYAPRSLMLSLMRKYQAQDITGQMYIGTTDGILYIYPAVRLPEYAPSPRFRPWYTVAVSPPKYLLIAIDTSIAMRQYFDLAKEVATIFINSSNPRDHISVFGFSAENVVTPPKMGSCFENDTLARATLPVQELLQQFVTSLSLRGLSHYGNVLQNLDNFARNKDKRRGTDSYVVIISGGPSSQTQNHVLDRIRAMKTSSGKAVKFVTINLGDGDNDILKAIGHEFGTYISSDGVKQPYDYFQRFIDAYFHNSHDAVVTPSFVDVITEEAVLSAPQAMYVEDHLVAAVGVEISTFNISHHINYMNSDPHRYMFVIDRFGLTAYHPRLPSLGLLVPIGNVEKEAQDSGVIASMLSSLMEDIHSQAATMARFYPYLSTLQVPNSELSTCAVYGHVTDNIISRYTIHPPIPSMPFVYHDIMHNQDVNKCRYYSRVVTKDSSTVMFSGTAFQEPFKYLNEGELPAKTRLYKDIVQGRSTNTIFKDRVIESVNITSVMDTDWSESELFVIWRVVATISGVTRSYPGVTENRHYLAGQRNWFLQAIWSPGDIIVSSPYVERSTGGFIITLSSALTSPKQEKEGERRIVFGVLKVDVFAEYMYTALLASYNPRCLSGSRFCFLVDDTGYVITHPDFIHPPTGPTTIPRIEQVHITQKESRIAESLIRHGIMEKVWCFDIPRGAVFHSYKMKQNVLISEKDERSRLIGAEIYHLHKTNVFLISRLPSPDEFNLDNAICHCEELGGTKLPRCSRDPSTNCDCPCLESVSYDLCNISVSNISMCTPLVESSDSRDSLMDDEAELLSRLDPCTVPDCQNKHTLNDCHHVAGCRWCSVSVDGSALNSKSFCGHRQECYFGMVGHHGILNDGAPLRVQQAWKYVVVMSFLLVSTIAGVLMIWTGHYWIYEMKSMRSKQGDVPGTQTSSEGLYKVHSYFGRLNHRRSIEGKAVSLVGQSDKGFYMPHSRCVYQSMQSLQRCQPLALGPQPIAAQPIAPLTDHDHPIAPPTDPELRSEAGLSVIQPWTPNWTPNSIQKSNTTYDVLKTRRRYQTARQQQMWSMSSGPCGIVQTFTPSPFKVPVNELRAHVDIVKKELYSVKEEMSGKEELYRKETDPEVQ